MTAIRALDGPRIDSNHHQNYSIPTYLHGSFLVDDIKVDVNQIKKKKVKLNTIVILLNFLFLFFSRSHRTKLTDPTCIHLSISPPVHMVYTLIKLAAILSVCGSLSVIPLFMATTVCYNAVVIGKKQLSQSRLTTPDDTHIHNSAVIALCQMDRHQWI